MAALSLLLSTSDNVNEFSIKHACFQDYFHCTVLYFLRILNLKEEYNS